MRSIADQRYYHFVVLKDKGHYSLLNYWRQVGDVLAASSENFRFRNQFCEIQQRKVRSAKPYARGKINDLLSESGKGNPPFLYDLFAAKVSAGDDNYFVFSYPFSALALDTVDLMAGRPSFNSSFDFQRVDIARLLQSYEKSSVQTFEDLSTHVVGLQLNISDDKCLTALRLGGDDPLNAQLYRDVLRENVRTGTFSPNQCVLACETPSNKDKSLSSTTEGGALRSRVHMDTFGNFKLYLHMGCSNIQLIPSILLQLDSLHCLSRSTGNPLRKLEASDSD